MHGIDISNWQADIDLSAVRPEFVIAKLSESVTFRDSSFDRFYNDCKNLGIPAGAYVYSHSTSAERGRAEAEYALSLLYGRPLDLPIYLDIEGDILGSNGLTASALAFAETVRSRGYRAGVYASLSAFRDSLDLDTLRANGISIWVAQWGVSAPAIECDVWQKAVGRVNGYAADIDLDVMFVTDINVADKQDVQPKLYPADMAVLCRGFYGTQVMLYQLCLNAANYPCEVNGVFDNGTDAATRKFQLDHGLVSDGIAGKNTFSKMEELLK